MFKLNLEVVYKEVARKVAYVYLLLITLYCCNAIASGFQIQEQNASNLGNAYAGVAIIEDASAAFYNPAALINIAEKQITIPLAVIIPKINLIATSAYAGGNNVQLVSAGTTMQDLPSKPAFIPALHYGARVTENVVFGLSVAVPFGAELEYSDIGIARYLATKTSITTGLISPSIAYKVLPNLSIAAGFDIAKTTAKLENKVPDTTPNLATDGYYKLSASGTAYGYHLGLFYKINEACKFGISYRSSFNTVLEGKRFFRWNTLVDEESAQVSSNVTLPNTLNVSVSIPMFVKQIAFLIDYQFTNWSTLQNLTVLNKEDNMSMVTPLYFKNTNRLALGLNVSPTENITFKVGIATDETPTSNAYRILRMPDADRSWVSAGFSYKLNKDISMDIGIARIVFAAATVNTTMPLLGDSPLYNATLTGSYDSSALIFGIQINYNFVE